MNKLQNLTGIAALVASLAGCQPKIQIERAGSTVIDNANGVTYIDKNHNGTVDTLISKDGGLKIHLITNVHDLEMINSGLYSYANDHEEAMHILRDSYEGKKYQRYFEELKKSKGY